MNERDLVHALKEKLKEKDEGWKFVYGREVLSAKEMIEKIDRDKKFRKVVVQMVMGLSMDLILREKP